MKDLAGRRVLVTRRSALTDRLVARGARVFEVPVLEIAPPEDAGPLDDALRALARYAWLAVTSANAVRAVADRLRSLGLGLPTALRLAAVGPSTARALEEAFPGHPPARQPAGDFHAEGLAHALQGEEVAGRRILLPVSDRARDLLATGLRGRGAQVDVVVAYRTLAVPEPRGLAAALAAGPELVVFASPSAVASFLAGAGAEGRALPAVALGSVTEAAAREAGLTVAATANPSTLEGLESAIAAWLATRGAAPR